MHPDGDHGFHPHYALMVTLRILLGIAEGPLFPLAFAVVRHLPAAATGPRHHAVAAWHAGWRGAGFLPSAVNLATTFIEHLFRDGDADGTGADFCAHRAARRALRAKVGSDKRRRKHAAARRELFVSPHFWMICIFNIAFLAYLWGINGWLLAT